MTYFASVAVGIFPAVYVLMNNGLPLALIVLAATVVGAVIAKLCD